MRITRHCIAPTIFQITALSLRIRFLNMEWVVTLKSSLLRVNSTTIITTQLPQVGTRHCHFMVKDDQLESINEMIGNYLKITKNETKN